MEKRLGDLQIELQRFSDLDTVFKAFKKQEFLEANVFSKLCHIGKELLNCIQQAEHVFLVTAITEFIDRVVKEEIVEKYSFSRFEFYLNQFSELSDEENSAVRAKIVGKSVPRDEYQRYFPIGMGKQYQGTHIVTAHSAPDLDTTVASFWGFIDAFAARVSNGLHIWNVPGGAPLVQIEVQLLFQEVFGTAFFHTFSKQREALTLTSIDLMTQSHFQKKRLSEEMLTPDYDRQLKATALVDEEGYYLGDWRPFDFEGVRQVVMSFNSILRWIEGHFHVKLIALFAEEQLNKASITAFSDELFSIPLEQCEPAKEFSQQQRDYCQSYMEKVLDISKGLSATFEEFAVGMQAKGLDNFVTLKEKLLVGLESDLFDKEGRLREDRPTIFLYLKEIVAALGSAIRSFRQFVDRLEVAYHVKTEVFGHKPQYLTHRSSIEEVQNKIKAYPYLTVNYMEPKGGEVPLGVVHAASLQKHPLGTVTLRDFCNREETQIPPYLEVISVIDHHKASLSTISPPMALIADAQSANVLVAGLAFDLNDRYSLGGMTQEALDLQIKEMASHLNTPSDMRIYRRLLLRKAVVERHKESKVCARREMLEYLHFLHAIMDDTDLLTKVGRPDIECVASLLNRLKSLMLRKEVEIVHFDGIADDAEFVKLAARHLLQNDDFYSLYSKVYAAKEDAVGNNLRAFVEGDMAALFSDTKVLNSTSRVSQTKIFANNYTFFAKNIGAIRRLWLSGATSYKKTHHNIDLHMHMVSTIASAEELYKGDSTGYLHADELWIWIRQEEELAIERLKLFLNGFKELAQLKNSEVEVELLGANAQELSLIFKESFLPVTVKKKAKENLPIAVIRYKAGSINSRKALIAPFLPNGE